MKAISVYHKHGLTTNEKLQPPPPASSCAFASLEGEARWASEQCRTEGMSILGPTVSAAIEVGNDPTTLARDGPRKITALPMPAHF